MTLSNPDTSAAVDHFVDRELRRLNVPGASLAVVEGDRIVHMRGFGQTEPFGPPPSPQTPFFIGSITKSFTALAIMQLVERGLVELDAPVRRYLPWFCVADADASAAMTVRHLLNQTSGFSIAVGSAVLGDPDDSPGACERQVRALATYRPPQRPGAEFDYSNTNFQVLGLIVEAVSGQPYASYVRDCIFRPLGMVQSYATKAEAQQSGLATGHRYWFWRPVPEPDLRVGIGPLAGGLLISSAEDMARYLIAYLNDGRSGEAQILSPAGIREMQRGAVEVEEMGVSIGRYGMGWFVSEVGAAGNATQAVWHSGLVPDFAAFVALIPAQKRGLVLLLNAGHFWMEPLMNEFGMAATAVLAGLPPPPSPMPWLRFMPTVMRALPLVPLLQAAGVAVTVRSLRSGAANGDARAGGASGWTGLIPLLPGITLAALPVLLRASRMAGFVKLYAPDIWWLAHVSGVLAALWSALRSGLVPVPGRGKRNGG